MFGKERFRHVISAHARDTAMEILQAVIDELDRFSHPLGNKDDVTLVVVKVKNSSQVHGSEVQGSRQI
jgi:serine phosphatase RsbU (regulator of sigma subunit)